MAWGDLDADLREIAERVCTDKELEALRLIAAGYGIRRAAMVLGIGRTTLRDRIQAAERRILNEVERGDES